MMHWAAQYILHDPPIAWRKDGEGPQDYNCWSFFRMIQKKHFSREVPIVRVDADDDAKVKVAFADREMYRGWRPVDIPREGDAVLFHGGLEENHIGVWLDADMGGVLHCMRKSGVVFTRKEAVRRMGWGRVVFYRYEGDQ